jgi:cell cycle sensor histidine kinase DivJ
MRSFLSSVMAPEHRGGDEAGVRAGGSAQLRHAVVAVNARIVLGASAALMLFAIYASLHAAFLPLLLATLGLTIGFLGLVVQQRTGAQAAAEVQVYGMLAVGAVLAIADPAIADFGLGVALLAPIHAALLCGRRTKYRAWAGLALVVGLAIASAAGIVPWPDGLRPRLHVAGGGAFIVAAIIVAFTANRLNTAFEVYDRGQINAFRHLLEHVQDAVVRFSPTGDLLFISRSSEKLFGSKRYELTGDRLAERVHLLDRPAYLTAFSDANSGIRSRTVEARVRFDGDHQATAPKYIWVEMALSPVLDSRTSDGRYEVVALLRDVTDRRDQENEMRSARKAAEAASEAKSRFLATIGHELRTPLNAIVGFSEMMTTGIGGELTPAHREYAELIHRSGAHLIGVVGMLLDMSRIEAGKFELTTERFAPEGLVEPCLSMVDALARPKQVRFVRELAPTLPPIVADERACRQILINLVSNAVKFSHQQGDVTIAMKRQGAFLNISVADKGIGMQPEAVARVGEPFFQAQDGLTRGYEGTGLGLSIVRGLVDLHQGTMRITSEPSTGTTVTVLLPINGPETKILETSSVMPLRREAASHVEVQWPEQKRSAK